MGRVKYNSNIPERSIISAELGDSIDYMDSFAVEIENIDRDSVDYLATLMFTSMPNWINRLMRLRNLIVKPFGINTEKGSIQRFDKSISYSTGDKLAIFLVYNRTDEELIMGDDDKHLNYRVSVFADESDHSVYLTTVVHFCNGWGRFYFSIVRPFHTMIVKACLANFRNQYNK